MRKGLIEPELLSREDAAIFLGLSVATLRRWYSRAEGPRVVKLGTGRASRVRYPRHELMAFANDPVGYAAQTRPDNMPKFDPPTRGTKRRSIRRRARSK